ncbi:hypothetical protein [Emcibacter sp. SYSU 3D8]|uniref:hypothetical protein n=1 Tax=Emcibacter sp. SYSU 3D8 TaxID=3133969 RepID=UPI0031FE9946
MNADSTARRLFMLASVLGLALTATAAYAQGKRFTGDADDKGTAQTGTMQSQPVTEHGSDQQTAKQDEHEPPDMILLREPFRQSPGTTVDYRRGK